MALQWRTLIDWMVFKSVRRARPDRSGEKLRSNHRVVKINRGVGKKSRVASEEQ
jgi:hypothetical protein